VHAAAVALAAAALAGLTAGAPAAASFTAPVELAAAQSGLGAAAATDAAGTTTVVVTGSGAPKLLERPAGAVWPAPIRLPGEPRGVTGPVVAAAGGGALGIAWRVDTPRKYGGIQAEVRDPGGALSTPIVIAGDDARGVRHPALAADPAGDTLLAYNTDTRKSHLSMSGAIAVSYRPAHGSFSKPVVLDDQPSTPPAVALAPDGTGIVAWSHNRRVYAASVARGRVGRAEEVAASSGLHNVVAAAGPDGEATIAWIRSGASDRQYQIRVLRRGGGERFAVQAVASTHANVPELVLATDEAGRTTAAWIEQDFGRPGESDRDTTAIGAATAASGHAFGSPRVVTKSTARERRSLSIAALKGRVALAWGVARDRHHLAVQAAAGPVTALGPPQTIASMTFTGDFFVPVPGTRITLAPSGAATVLATIPTQPSPNLITSRLVAIDGR
jgi:hypothetical protein